jgi:hypothetical protein
MPKATTWVFSGLENMTCDQHLLSGQHGLMQTLSPSPSPSLSLSLSHDSCSVYRHVPAAVRVGRACRPRPVAGRLSRAYQVPHSTAHAWHALHAAPPQARLHTPPRSPPLPGSSPSPRAPARNLSCMERPREVSCAIGCICTGGICWD